MRKLRLNAPTPDELGRGFLFALVIFAVLMVILLTLFSLFG